MANSYFEVDVGVNVGGVSITATTGNITAGNITTTGNITINSAYNMTANSVVQKSYVDNIAVVFGI
jgi:hypothetical protein